MTELECERKKLNDLIEKYGLNNELVLEQSKIVDKLIREEMNIKSN